MHLARRRCSLRSRIVQQGRLRLVQPSLAASVSDDIDLPLSAVAGGTSRRARQRLRIEHASEGKLLLHGMITSAADNWLK